MKIGVLGGTFNPIHVGHLMLGEFSFECCDLDEIWFLPNCNPPHKNTNMIDTTDTQRMEMIQQAIEFTSYFVLKKYEMNEGKVYYSYETMERLKEMYPSYEFFFIIGSDSLFTLEKWMHVERLLKSCTILVAFRETGDINRMETHISYLELKYNAKIQKLNAPVLEISSSNIRRRVAKNLSIKYLVPEVVREYIKVNDLYREGM